MNEQVRKLESAERAVVRALDAVSDRVSQIGTVELERATARLRQECLDAEERIRQAVIIDCAVDLAGLLASMTDVADGLLTSLDSVDGLSDAALTDDTPTLPVCHFGQRRRLLG